MRTFVFPVAMAAVVVACGSFGEDSSRDSAPDSGTLADADATRLPSEAGVGSTVEDAGAGLSNDSGPDAGPVGVETSPCSVASLFCEDFDHAAVIDGSRLTKNDNFAATATLLPKPGAGHDGSGTIKLTLPDDKTKVQGEIYFTLPKQKVLYEIVFRTTATNGFDIAGVAVPSFESGITLTRGAGSALDLWSYSGSGGSLQSKVTDVTLDGSAWTYAAIEVDPTTTPATFRAFGGAVGKAPTTSPPVNLSADFSGGVRYHFGPYRNDMPSMGTAFEGAAMVEVDWVRVTAR